MSRQSSLNSAPPLISRLFATIASSKHALWTYRVVLAGAATCVLVWSLRLVWAFTIDDAGISYAYAKHIADGDGPVASVGGPWVEGYSNPLWVFSLVPFHALGLPVPVVAKVLGVCLLLGSLIAVAAFLRAALGRSLELAASTALVAVVLAACLEHVVWVVAGLENPLFAFLLLSLAALNAGSHTCAWRSAAQGGVAFALCITRPEGVLYCSGWAALEIAKTALRKGERRSLIIALSSWLLPLALYQVIHYAVFRQILPNTYLAKPPHQGLQAGIEYLRREISGSGLIYVLPFALVGSVRRPAQKALLFWYCVSGGAFILYAGGDWMPHGRFVSLFAPALITLGAAGLIDIAAALAAVARGRLPHELIVFSFAAPLAAAWVLHQRPRLEDLARRKWCHFCDRVADAQAVTRLTRRAGLEASSLVTHDFGGPAWLSSPAFYPIDFLGLCDRSVALIRRDRKRRGGSIGDEPRLYQYLFHEQAQPPSFLYLPSNFWPRLSQSPEYELGYVPIPRGVLRAAPDNAMLALHRSELVDYFPPIPRFEFRDLGGNMTLVGHASFRDALQGGSGAESAVAGSGARLRVRVSLLARARLAGHERLAVAAQAGDERVQTESVPLLPSLRGVARHIGAGDPLAFDFTLQLPAAAAGSVALSLGIEHGADGTGASRWSWTALDSIAVGSAVVAETRSLPPYPNALPIPLDPELRRWQSSVAGLVEQRRRTGDLTLADAGLARELTRIGEALELRGEKDQAYLAYVWATQLSKESWRDLADDVFRLRPAPLDDEHALELSLLEAYYRAADAPALRRLIAFYLGTARLTQAEYFLERASPFALDAELQASLARLASEIAASASPTRELPTGVVYQPLPNSDFEAPELAGWEGKHAMFLAGDAAEHRDRPGLRGHRGRGVLSSMGGAKRGRGELLSPEFPLDGAWLSLLVGGSARRAGVELLVGGRAVQSAKGNDSDVLLPVFWNISALRGQRARLRVFDEDPRSHVLVDRVLIWR